MKTTEKRIVSNNLFRICFVGFMVLYLSYLCFLGSQKINFHIDEYFTYALANKEDAMMPVWPVWEDGYRYEGSSYFEQNMMPEGTERFNYSNVWENQANDVHPPFYYVLVHTMCSIFPESFSKWHGLVINFILMMIINIQVYFIAKRLFGNRWTALITMMTNAMTLLMLNMAMFLRMYGLMTVFVLGIISVFLEYVRKKKDWKFYVGTCILAVCGALTQYYFLIFLFFACLVFGISLLWQRKWKDALCFIGSLGGAAAISIFTFPSMIVQIFGGSDRGQEAFQNIRTLPNMIGRLKDYYHIINSEVFGGTMPLFAVLGIMLLVLGCAKHWVKRENIQDLCLILIPAVTYCVFVALIAPYMQNRYIMGSGPLWVFASIWIVYYLCVPLFKEGALLKVNAIIAVAACVLVISSMNDVKWEPTYTYQYMRERYTKLEDYKECSVVYVYDYSWTFNDNMVELVKYKDYTFVKPENLRDYIVTRDDEKVIFYNESPMENDEIVSIVLESNPKLTSSLLLFKNSSESIIYFE